MRRRDPPASSGVDADHLAHAVDMALHEVSTEPSRQGHGPLQVDRRADIEPAQAGACDRLLGEVEAEAVGRARPPP